LLGADYRPTENQPVSYRCISAESNLPESVHSVSIKQLRTNKGDDFLLSCQWMQKELIQQA